MNRAGDDPRLRGFALPTDLDDFEYDRELGDPGTYPFTRGQAIRPGSSSNWIHRELSGEGDARRSNAQLRYLIDHGAAGLDVIGDAPTVGLLDPDHPYARQAVGSQGVSISRVQDYYDLYDGIRIDEVSISHSLSAPFTIAGLYLTAKRRGIDPGALRGSVINAPFYMEDYAYATFLPFAIRYRMALDAIEFASRHMPKFHPFVEDTYFISDGGIGPVDEMAFGFVEIREVVRGLLARGLEIDSFAPRIAILVNCRMDLLTEIAKVRATRRLMARMMREEFGATDPRSWSANVTVHTSGASLTAQQPINNVVRGALQALAMALAGVKAMEISAFDEAYRTPSEAAHMVGLRTQQILGLETDIGAFADPLGGSYLVEHRTSEIEQQILDRIHEIEALGPAEELVDRGYFRGEFQAAMAARSRAIMNGSQPVVGVNCFTIPEGDDTVLRDLTDVKIEPYVAHIDKIRGWKETRAEAPLTAALDRIADAAAEPATNLMPAILAGFEADVTIGEMASAIRVGIGLPADRLSTAVRDAS